MNPIHRAQNINSHALNATRQSLQALNPKSYSEVYRSSPKDVEVVRAAEAMSPCFSQPMNWGLWSGGGEAGGLTLKARLALT